MPGRLTHRRDMVPDDVSGNPSWPEGFTQLLADYERHLTAERDLSTHSVRAYIGDVADLLEHLIRLGHDDLGGLDIRGLRSWLAKQQSLGKSRSTMARRATAARVFTAWAQRTERIGTDPGALLASPKPHKSLPGVLGQADTRAVLDAAAVAADDGSPVGLRDLAIMELLYATGIRVGELCALDVDDIDHSRRVVRVFGKGRKERSVPYGVPAAEALERWLAEARPKLARRGAVRPPSSARVVGGSINERYDGWCTSGSRSSMHRISPRMGCGIQRPRISSKVARICGACRSCWGMRRWRRPRSIRMSPAIGCGRPICRRIRGLDEALREGDAAREWLNAADCGTCGFRRSLTMRCEL